jgi:hypothetical protein
MLLQSKLEKWWISACHSSAPVRVSSRQPGALICGDPERFDLGWALGDAVAVEVELGEPGRNGRDLHHAPVGLGKPEPLVR